MPDAQLGVPPTDVDVAPDEVVADPDAPALPDPDTTAETEPSAPSNETARGDGDEAETPPA